MAEFDSFGNPPHKSAFVQTRRNIAPRVDSEFVHDPEDAFTDRQDSAEVGKVFDAIVGLSEQVRDMRRTMNHMQISVSEKDAEIVKLQMTLGDERQKVLYRFI